MRKTTDSSLRRASRATWPGCGGRLRGRSWPHPPGPPCSRSPLPECPNRPNYPSGAEPNVSHNKLERMFRDSRPKNLSRINTVLRWHGLPARDEVCKSRAGSPCRASQHGVVFGQLPGHGPEEGIPLPWPGFLDFPSAKSPRSANLKRTVPRRTDRDHRSQPHRYHRRDPTDRNV
jgi:hypothetical protein